MISMSTIVLVSRCVLALQPLLTASQQYHSQTRPKYYTSAVGSTVRVHQNLLNYALNTAKDRPGQRGTSWQLLGVILPH